MPPDRANGPGDGEQWLFKQDGLLLGPVPTAKLIELLNSGEIDGQTPVAPFGTGGSPAYRPLAQIDGFRVHLAKAQARQRVEAQSLEQRERARKNRLIKVGAIGALGLALVLGGGRLAWWLAIHRPWETQLELPQPVIAEDDDLPVITLASLRSDDEFDYPDTAPTDSPAPGKRAVARAETKRPSTPAAPGRKGLTNTRPSPKRTPAPLGDDVAIVQQWDQDAINSVVRANKKTLHACLNAEAQRQRAGWSARIPIEFTIGNDGRVSKLWIDNPDYKRDTTELYKCMFQTLRRWKFPKYAGEQANVSLSFTVGAR